MYYYEVAPADRSYQGSKLLTYYSSIALSVGQVIVVNVRTKKMQAIVIAKVSKPMFKVAAIEKIAEDVVLPITQIKLFEWLLAYYLGSVGATARLFLPTSLNKPGKQSQKNDVVKTTINPSLPKLTNQQTQTTSSILSSKTQTHIIHGDTGTGKTRVYLELAKTIIEQNKSVIILTPEISLTPQLFEQFNNQFSLVTLVHSTLSEGSRRASWREVLSSAKPRVIIGPRSALFYPVNNIGLIIIDEFHDSAYKQDQTPRYSAVKTAAMLARLSRGKLVLGSATPPIEDYFYAVKKASEVHRITEKPLQSTTLKNVYIVNLSDPSERSAYPLLSKTLIEHITKTLHKNEQVLLFLNKRGTSRLLVCQNCGWHANCTRCNVSYVYHEDTHRLVCHICNMQTVTPSSCPECSSTDLLFKNPGTKAIAESLQKIFPNAKIGRYDKDNKKNERFAENQAAIAAGKIDILVGTQLLTKGHDLPKLSLVAILLAEGSLQFPDYNAEEKSFQLLHQIAGRVGRGHNKGTVLLQAYSPTDKLKGYIYSTESSWINFYTNQIQQRKKYNFPPFCFLLKIDVSRKNEKIAEKFIQKIYSQISSQNFSEIELCGPAPAFFYKKNNAYHWQIVIKSKSRKTLLSIIKLLPNSCTYDIDPVSLL